MSGICVEIAPSLWGLQWFATKPMGSLVDPQSQDRRPKCVQLITLGRSDGGGHQSDQWASWASRDSEAEDTRHDCKVSGTALEVPLNNGEILT
jgi:hypothetical protein